ncbi:WxL domain-containing protein [Lactiplantibacillus fabifermentans]|uniref:WxL domain-containing protein n=2 Tax=Lactiplantibacillus fabifermentans TaxID=483011 RepID=A0A0R2NQM9_9LACO|nr:WxL domain-containing protein [Lactiplantibacillus fabifermentans]ETY72518.1 cell surface protein [Lactiplantibacillus fabifermentans T30PCM01]KRO27999.1 hypothetical protein DY78_GL002735 [Lactiplantibacillus fabifermentans DSM 21115]
MSKKASSWLMAGALLLGATLPVVAQAATVTSTKGSTDSQVEFTAPSNVTKPVDPTDPGTTVTDPDSGDNGGATVDGALTFLYVSPAINFGSHQTVTTGTQSIQNDSTGTPVTVTSQKFGSTAANTNLVTEISDTRGTNAGWNVQVSSSALTLTGGSDTLKGAYVNLSAADTSKNTIANSASTTGISGTDTQLSTDTANAATIYTASTDNGAGSTAFQLSPDNISMTSIPANVKSGTYTGELTWTLNDTPTN